MRKSREIPLMARSNLRCHFCFPISHIEIQSGYTSIVPLTHFILVIITDFPFPIFSTILIEKCLCCLQAPKTPRDVGLCPSNLRPRKLLAIMDFDESPDLFHQYGLVKHCYIPYIESTHTFWLLKVLTFAPMNPFQIFHSPEESCNHSIYSITYHG